MKKMEVEVFSTESNCAVVRVPGRKFPGSVVQGDSLQILCDLAIWIHERAKLLGDEELIDAALQLEQLLLSRQKHYEDVLIQHNIELPYNRK